MKESSVYARPSTFSYTMFIDDEINQPSNYRDEFDVLHSAQKGDEIIININSSGGQLDTTLQFISAINSCQGHVITQLAGQACSGAAMILLSGHEIRVSHLSEVMAHSVTAGYHGKVSDVVAFAVHHEKHTTAIMTDIYGGFLTEDELSDLHNGREFWMQSDEFLARLDNKVAFCEVIIKQEKQDDNLDLDLPEELPDSVLNKLTKQQLVKYINGTLDVVVDSDGEVLVKVIKI